LTNNGRSHLHVVVRVALYELIANDMEWLDDYVDEWVLPANHTAGLMDFHFNIVGHESDQELYPYGAGFVLLHVSADASEVIREMEEE
jgi:hypothetical protein